MNNILINGYADTRICNICGKPYTSRGKNDPGICKDCEREKGYSSSSLSGGNEEFNKVEGYVQAAINIAKDDTHGYSQSNRDGYPDYDCSSLVCHVVQASGIPVMDNGASYTGNMREAFLKSGFANVTSQVNLANCNNMVRGDILLRDDTYQHQGDHTAMYIGNKQIVQAGGPNGHPEPGDQTGEEIKVMNYYNFPWAVVLRYPYHSGDTNNIQPDIPYTEPEHINHSDYPEIIRYGDWGEEVLTIQKQLKTLGYYKGELDGRFGEQTLAAVMKFQEKNRLAMDGEVGPLTKAALNERYNEVEDKTTGVVELGQIVEFKGGKARLAANAELGRNYEPGRAKITAVRLDAKHPYHLSPAMGGSSVYGWVDGNQIKVV